MSTSVRLLRQVAGEYGVFQTGEMASLPDHVALAWIDAGVAARAPASEAATLAPAETADLPRPAGRRPRS